MKPTLTAVALLVAFVAPGALASITTYPIWSSTYKDSNGGLMVLLKREGKLNVYGADSGSIYRLVCTLESDLSASTICTGDGVNYEQADNPRHFTYRSKLIHHGNADGSISEEWECVFEFNAEKRNGKSLFKRVNGIGSGLTR